jgi:hypothetical protein
MRSKQAVIRLVMVFAFAAIALHVYAKIGYSSMSETENVHAASETKVFKHAISSPWTGARLKVVMRVDQGAAVLRLIDANGSTRLEKTFGSGEGSVDQTFTGGGVWRVELQLKNTTGRYAIHLIGV